MALIKRNTNKRAVAKQEIIADSRWKTKQDEVSAIFGKDAPSVATLSRATKISQTHLWRVFRKERVPSLVVAKDIANALGVSLDQFHDALYRPVDHRRTA